MNVSSTTRLIATIVFNFFLTGVTAAFALNDRNSERPTAIQLLTDVHKKLESLKTLQYHYSLELNYVSEGYHQSISGIAFLDFSSPDSVIGFTYQIESEQNKFVYNGTESFTLDKVQKSLTVNAKPTFENFSGVTPFHNSLVTLRKVIPAILADRDIIKTVSDTSIAQQDFYLVKLVLNKRVIDRLGGFSDLSLERKINYDIIVDKSSLIPVQMIQGNSANSDFTRSVFSDVKTSPDIPAELSWYFSSYTSDFAIKRRKPLEPPALQTPAPEWELPLFDSSQSLRLSQLKGKVVILAFWTKNCGYCIAAVPRLNALSEKFQGKGLVVLGVNLHDNKEEIHNFNQRTKPAYKTVYDGQRIGEAYGVSFYPTIVVLDKKGKVLAHGELNESALNDIILKALKE
ncbi:TlpA disulfide reductase family protein [Pontibacter sp. BT731]|uniref:TlpA family protein disulfide reductase n=1 Tax=Pontibacter coccineus TaxID=3063328 RepID=UPI0026E17ACB|nr:TlpA disulfide reductase family protein [Pontibacter sp. BT731]MDO6391168.1 TlpA disulfide reductase family protein [Pontibacter sp. BT731]